MVGELIVDSSNGSVPRHAGSCREDAWALIDKAERRKQAHEDAEHI